MKFKLLRLLGITSLLAMTFPVAVAHSQVRTADNAVEIGSQ